MVGVEVQRLLEGGFERRRLDEINRNKYVTASIRENLEQIEEKRRRRISQNSFIDTDKDREDKCSAHHACSSHYLCVTSLFN